MLIMNYIRRSIFAKKEKQEQKEKNYYDSIEVGSIQKLINKNPLLARQRLEEYLETHPDDDFAFTLYASILTIFQEFELAEEVINSLEERIKNKKYLMENESKRMHTNASIVVAKTRILCHTGRYEELEKLLLDNEYVVDKCRLGSVLLYCKVKLGEKIKSRDEYDNYSTKQIVDYKEEDLIAMVDGKRKQKDCDSDVFNYDFPLSKVIEELKIILPDEDKKLCYGAIDESYIIRFDNCGRCNSKMANYFKVSCFENTSKIITMFPIDFGENINYIDLNYLNNTQTKDVPKQMSRTEKFYQRYGIKKES